MRAAAALLTAALLGGCGASSDQVAKPRATKKDRAEAAEQQLAKTPLPRTYRYADAELRVLQVPVPDGFGFVEQQQCFVWRDLEFKTSTISCSVPPDVTPSN